MISCSFGSGSGAGSSSAPGPAPDSGNTHLAQLFIPQNFFHKILPFQWQMQNNFPESWPLIFICFYFLFHFMLDPDPNQAPEPEP
jgi:hypothetical protein